MGVQGVTVLSLKGVTAVREINSIDVFTSGLHRESVEVTAV